MFGLGPVEMLLGVALFFMTLSGAIYGVVRLVQLLSGGARCETDLSALNDRTRHLEEGLADLTTRLDRLAEGQEFTNRILAERSEARARNS